MGWILPGSRSQTYVAFVLLACPDFPDQKTQTRFSFPGCKYVVEMILWTNIKQEAKIDTIAISFLAKKNKDQSVKFHWKKVRRSV